MPTHKLQRLTIKEKLEISRVREKTSAVWEIRKKKLEAVMKWHRQQVGWGLGLLFEELRLRMLQKGYYHVLIAVESVK